MKKIEVILIVMFIAVIASLITAFIIEKSRVLQVEKFPMEVTVTDDPRTIGINVDPDQFNFGIIPQGNTGKRSLSISTDQEVYVTIKTEGNISPMINYKNYFLVGVGAENISVNCVIPDDEPPGVYTGEMTVILRKTT